MKLNYTAWCWHCNGIIPQGSVVKIVARKKNDAVFHEDCLWPHRKQFILNFLKGK